MCRLGGVAPARSEPLRNGNAQRRHRAVACDNGPHSQSSKKHCRRLRQSPCPKKDARRRTGFTARGSPHEAHRTGFTARGSPHGVHRTGFTARGSLRGVHRTGFTARGSLRGVHRTGFTARGSPHGVHRTGFTARGSPHEAHRTRLTARGSPHEAHRTGFTARGGVATVKDSLTVQPDARSEPPPNAYCPPYI